MKAIILAITATVLLAGCASFEEAYYLDREFGQDSMAAWDGQVAYPDYRYAKNTPEGTNGITAEEIMDVYNETFAEEPEKVDVFQLGIQQ
jgi:hypothetical protein